MFRHVFFYLIVDLLIVDSLALTRVDIYATLSDSSDWVSSRFPAVCTPQIHDPRVMNM